jgi:rhodanese-related sulfurtransferase
MAIKDVFAEVELLKANLENLSIDELKEEMAANPDLLLIDIREIQELIDLGTIPGAVHVARGMMEFWASPASPYYRDYFQEDRRIVAFCAGGGRSVYAVRDLKELGFTNVAQLEVGFNGWEKSGSTVEDVATTSRWMRRPKAEE